MGGFSDFVKSSVNPFGGLNPFGSGEDRKVMALGGGMDPVLGAFWKNQLDKLGELDPERGLEDYNPDWAVDLGQRMTPDRSAQDIVLGKSRVDAAMKRLGMNPAARAVAQNQFERKALLDKAQRGGDFWRNLRMLGSRTEKTMEGISADSSNWDAGFNAFLSGGGIQGGKTLFGGLSQIGGGPTEDLGGRDMPDPTGSASAYDELP